MYLIQIREFNAHNIWKWDIIEYVSTRSKTKRYAYLFWEDSEDHIFGFGRNYVVIVLFVCQQHILYD